MRIIAKILFRGVHILFFALFLVIAIPLPYSLHSEKLPTNQEGPLALDLQALGVMFSAQETMHFSVAWSGGVKIGDLVLSLTRNRTGKEMVIKARITDHGLFHLLYPVNDTFTTFVHRPWMLPSRYEVSQREGSREIQRLTLYNQEQGEVRYRKHQDELTSYPVAGPVYNEFSAFFITRVLRLEPDNPQFVPAFVDKKRHLVAVKVLGKEKRETMFGMKNTIKVMPELDFKGLYDKDGATVFWLSDDSCRIPVEIRSKILIGSLVAKLVKYSNPACRVEL
ncbi:DUF3108 domain-containing protein [Desulfobulbus sp. TB]|nr:DUF3108 domain-containing protein [Desulfobulbus sp. TB]